MSPRRGCTSRARRYWYKAVVLTTLCQMQCRLISHPLFTSCGAVRSIHINPFFDDDKCVVVVVVVVVVVAVVVVVVVVAVVVVGKSMLHVIIWWVCII